MRRLLPFLKTLPREIDRIKLISYERGFSSIDLSCQDESRLGLMTKQKKVLVKKGIAPINNYQHSYSYVWLWGIFSMKTGKSFYWETPIVNNLIFEDYLEAYSQIDPEVFKIVIIDNAGFHSTKNIKIPHNVYLLRIPPYSPELNPAEKMWQWIKDKTAMKFFTSLEDLQNKITEIINNTTIENVKSITQYPIYKNVLSGNF